MVPEENDTVSEVKHRYGKLVASHECARVNKSIIYTTMHKEKTLIYKLSRSKASKTQRICHYTMQ